MARGAVKASDAERHTDFHGGRVGAMNLPPERAEQLAFIELDKAMKALADTPLHSLHDLENARRRVARRKAHWADTLRALDRTRAAPISAGARP